MESELNDQKLANEPFGIVCYDDEGNKFEYNIDFLTVGKMLCSLEVTRELLGHSTFRSTFRYVHDPTTETPEFLFIRGILEREHGTKRKQGGDIQ